MMINNYYIIGRQKEINGALQLLRKQNRVEILGIKGVGKSYFLNYLQNYTSKTGKFITLLFNSPFGFNLLNDMQQRLKRLLIQHKISVNLKINLDNLGAIVKKIENKTGMRLVFFFDDAHEYELDILKKIASQVDNTGSKIVYTSIKPIFSGSAKITLTPFERKDTYKFILKKIKGIVSKDSMLFIHYMCGGIPKYLDFILLLLKNWSLQKNTLIDENIAKNILFNELKRGMLENLLLENLRAYVFVYGRDFIKILGDILTDSRTLPRAGKQKRIMKQLISIGLIDKQNDLYYLVDPLLKNYLLNHKQNKKDETKNFDHFIKIEKHVKKLFSNYTIIGNDIRIYEKGLLFQVSSDISSSKITDLLKIKALLKARKCYYICPKVNIRNETNSLAQRNQITIIMHETRNYSELIENAFKDIRNILLRVDSNSQ